MRKFEHFSLDEMKCNDGTDVPVRYHKNVECLFDQLTRIRHALGDRPVTIISGYRTPTYNKEVGGVENSQHLRACAADIKISGVSPQKVHDTILKMIKLGGLRQGGVGLYKTFVHYDIRGRAARWRQRGA